METHTASGSSGPESARVTADAKADNDDPIVAADAAAVRGKPRFGTATPEDGSSPESRIVEVQFSPGATKLATALASDEKAFLDGTEPEEVGPEGVAVRTILLRHRLEASTHSFAARFIEAEKERLAANAGGELAPPDPLAELPLLQSFVRLWFPTPEAAAAAARDLRPLQAVEKAVVVPRALPPNLAPLPTDPFIGTPEQGVCIDPITQHQPQWYLHRTSVLDAWSRGVCGAGVVIADIDWGFFVKHPDLAPRLDMAKAFNAFNHDNVVDKGPEIAHGTGVLGFAGAAADGVGMAGYAPKASLWPIQGDSGTGMACEDAWQDAIEHVLDEDSGGRRKVIIFEVQTDKFGNYEQVPSIHAAVRRAIVRDAVVCVAAGNGGKAADLADDGITPINPTGSILVGATVWDPDPAVNRRWTFSNWGPAIVVSAPGDPAHDITCSEHGDYIDGFGATSGAAPKVAGVAALMLSANPALSHKKVREILCATGTRVEPDLQNPEKTIGVFLNAAAAVREALRLAKVDASGARSPAPEERR